MELYNIAEEDLDLDRSASEESPHAWTTEGEQSDDETEEELELGVFTTQQKEDPENLKFMSKGDYRHVRSAVKNIQECMIEEKKVQNLKKSIPGRGKIEKPLSAAAAGERRPGPWRFLEIFTWTCAITMAAHLRGWETYEPITLPGWNLDLPEVRAKARAYIEEVDPDFIMIAPPCGPWIQIQIINQEDPDADPELAAEAIRCARVAAVRRRGGALSALSWPSGGGGESEDIVALAAGADEERAGLAGHECRRGRHVRLRETTTGHPRACQEADLV